MHVRAAFACIAVGLVAIPAHAGERSLAAGTFALSLDGMDSGFVHSTIGTDGARKMLVLSTEQPSAPVLAVVHAFLDGKATKRSVVLSTPALIQKASDARLVDVRFPSYAGGTTDIALTFEVGATSSSPSLRTVNDRAKPSTAKLASFRLAMGDFPTNEATQLDTVVVQKREGAAVPARFTFDVPSRSAPLYVGWAKKPTVREGAIEYVSVSGEPVLAVKVAGCTPLAAKIDGPVTHVTVQCTRATGGVP